MKFTCPHADNVNQHALFSLATNHGLFVVLFSISSLIRASKILRFILVFSILCCAFSHAIKPNKATLIFDAIRLAQRSFSCQKATIDVAGGGGSLQSKKLGGGVVVDQIQLFPTSD